MKYIRKFVQVIFHRFGFQLSYYRDPLNSFSKLYPHCWHDQGFVYDIFGHLLYQNVTDLPNYSNLSGLSLRDYRNQNSDEIAEFIDRIKPGQTVLDIGANIGLETLLLAKLVGGKVQHMVSLFIWMIPAQHIVTLKWHF